MVLKILKPGCYNILVRITRFKKLFKTYQKGFTLIELMVVVSIIALLSTVVMTAVEANKNKAMDRSLVVSAIQLRNALELYKTDNGFYPTINGPAYTASCLSNISTGAITCSTDADALKQKLSPYIKDIMKPLHKGSGYYYLTPSTAYRRCAGQDHSPEYLVIIEVKNDTTFPSYLYENWPVNPARKCISSLE